MKFFVFRTRPIITIKTSLYFIADKELVVKAIVHNWHWHWHKHFNWCCWWWMGGLWWGRRLPGCAGDVRQGRVWPGLIIRARAHYIISLLSPQVWHLLPCSPGPLLQSSSNHRKSTRSPRLPPAGSERRAVTVRAARWELRLRSGPDWLTDMTSLSSSSHL